ncbi:MAG: hypothetical protein WBA97_08425 [Actinophytocola sp.]|uniref:hypothetical protein n=1 Tax=Actinophytocola sp. TaxID=1872138 RepID=UPI003C735E02
MYTPEPSRPRMGRPAPSTPLQDYLRNPHPGTPADYVVLPKSLVEAMPLPWQNAMTQILQEFHQAYGHLDWPEYRVVPSRKEMLVNLDEEQLAEVGYLVEIDVDGELVYRERSGRRIDNPEDTEVLVSVLDPIPDEYRNANEDTPPRGFPAQQVGPWS